MTYNNFDDKDNENKDNTTTIIEPVNSQNNTEFKEGADILNVIINNFLLEYDLEPKNVLEIMTRKYYYNKQDYNTAIEWYSKSSEGVGYYCSKGYGTLKDEIKAFEFYLKAAEKGHSSSQYLVANWYNNGKHVLRNEEKGFYWDRKAAINSNVDAQFELSKYYINSSINKNERKAFK
ncbi:Sel1 repeat family protein [Rhizophagus clarus]|uniref:Sel1 repeat family protein n=1 Tax=Rhizophagus clarus TaxID=94130 RepID=A0A8H3ME36_9GLOM|nr:Sel1 repeat family protein [Rhizophagus clarus]